MRDSWCRINWKSTGEERSVLFLQRDYFNYLQGYISDKERMGEIIAQSMIGINDLFLERSILELSNLQKQYRDLLLTLSPDMPAVKLVQDEIGQKVKGLQANVESNLDRVAISINDVEQRITGVEKEISRLPATERKLIGIQRKFDLNNTVYTYLLEKKAEADIALASRVSDNRVIDFADINNAIPVKPRKGRNRLIAFILGILIPVSGIVVIDFFNNKIIDRMDIERLTDVPVLGFISHNDYKSEIPVLSRSGSTLAESFRSVRTALKYYKTPDGKAIISISSTVSSEGKTFISVNLAAIMALLGKKVLLVGLDLRKPRLHKILDTDNSIGMSVFLSGNAEYDEVIKKSEVDNLWYAPSGPVPPNPAELIESEYMSAFLKQARNDFDYIILDTPPVAIVTDALLLSPYSDINIFVVRQRYSSKNTLSLIQELYHSGKFKNLALIVNDISLSGYYGYGLRYGYAMSYGGYNYGYNLYGDYTYSTYGYKRDSNYYSDNENEDI
ncbi:MAG: polysaccharide biosynthesis tyrosine autokinase [Bacteroidia bacterium]|nr:MAG: polysaccharide biosynthesis tyrosine autokinase [Bacteroidia bacterium]